MSRIAVLGIGHGKFGRRSDATVQELAFEAFRDALQDAGLERKDLDATVIGSVPEYHKQRSLAGVVQEYLNLNPIPTWLTEVACASGSAAVRTAWMGIKSGLHDVVAVIGCQKMTELATAEILALMGRVGEVQWESIFGTTFPGYYALFAQAHMHAFGTTRQQLAQVAVKNHYYGARNPNALFQKEITVEKALESEPVASPLNVYDCCANADGAACVILASEKRAKSAARKKPLVWLDGVGCATASMSVLRRPNLHSLPSASDAAQQAYRMAEVAPRDIQVAEVHDCFSIAEIMAYEDLGFCEKGQGGRYIEDRKSWIGGGGVPVNVDGGLKAKGHPIGATGVSMACEIVKQLRGDSGARQVPNARVGLTHNVGGIGQYTFVHVYKRD
ncbi:MAG: thiolase domain-containing protein [Planctomycetes bacterium]|nr:thiolase domain-containing protein [Planctomycetota bacterium]